mmetsp:Transcript_8834/g.21038  ORF Transcript_8834/g.21038 Transcript_8834/m.21038 type:complete len:201 (-) Transcript_8834:218-820(-)
MTFITLGTSNAEENYESKDEEDSRHGTLHSDDESSADNYFVHGVRGRGPGDYESDGFLVLEDDDDDDDMSVNECDVCGKEGELLICDGGDHADGCGRGFHVACVGLESIPSGDWICTSCSEPLGHKTQGLRGYEFPVAPSQEEAGDGSDSDLEFEFDVIHENREKRGNGESLKSPASALKRRVFIDSDEEEDAGPMMTES